ncbi:signal peptidase II [Subsaxibacter sp. CAU 1640]|uniref:signal peptidase II n=1 Tax=Subsaxibacter sp. CAU 1640 TaxID=2933271 RepID=UPI002002A885|nr:signal peptidase II [Subsaxibacter sp. CAU 1640]MCK7590348.1 signal peptidase II [Subsaxibacter sp. CAU 1640]
MKLSRTLGIILLIVANIAIDQISKVIVRAKVSPFSETPIIGDYFTLHNVENKGAFLGMGSELSDTSRLIFLLILPILVLGYVIYYILRNRTLDRMSLIAFCCIVGGGIANVFDRIVYGSVTDFFHIDLGGVFRTGIFNVADMSVSAGMIMLLIASFRSKKN